MIQLTRKFAMPSKDTFTMIPVAELIAQRMQSGEVWADPFAGWNSPATITNDLNPEAPTDYHLEAGDFAAQLGNNSLDGVLLDPPYSPRQISEMYKSIGLTVGMEETQNGALYKRVKDTITPKLKPNGTAICFGWNSQGFCKARGFQLEQILLIPHGGGHNDTIITVERKIQANLL